MIAGHDNLEPHEFREHGNQDAKFPEELPQRIWDYLGNRWAIVGPAMYCRDRLRALNEVGVDNVLFTFPTGAPLEHARESTRRYWNRCESDRANRLGPAFGLAGIRANRNCFETGYQ